MPINYTAIRRDGLSTQISDTLRDAIIAGELSADQRLPSETELAERFGVSRPTVREALKRLAAQNLIRTQRGATGGAFVNRLDWAEELLELFGLPRALLPHLCASSGVVDAIDSSWLGAAVPIGGIIGDHNADPVRQWPHR